MGIRGSLEEGWVVGEEKKELRGSKSMGEGEEKR